MPDTVHATHEPPARPALPTTSSAFALPPPPSTSSPTDEGNQLMFRFRRPSLLAPKASYHSHSPLVSSYTPSLWRRRRRSQIGIGDESESDKERMFTDSSPSGSSENPTPPLTTQGGGTETEGTADKEALPQPVPQKSLNNSKNNGTEAQETAPSKRASRRFSHPLKPPRLLNLVAESRPEDVEVKSEAAFQRLLSSYAELPTQPRTPRSISDRGRYPEEAVREDQQREPSPSDDDGEYEETFAYMPSSVDTAGSGKAPSLSLNTNGDDMPVPESPSFAMDVDMPLCSPMSCTSSNHWRYTPPPTSSAVRTNKRKYDDRYDPYPTSSKRRAVSPSISQLRDAHPSIISPILNPRGSGPSSRIPISIPISIPNSAASSVASSPTVSSSFSSSFTNGRSTLYTNTSISSSPILRPAGGLASPVLRPLLRRRLDGEEREVEGAGEAVGGLNLGV